MKKLTSVLLCMVLVLSMLCVNVAAAETACMEAGVTVSEDGTVTVAVRAKQPAANARLTVDFDSDYLTYVGCETGFAVHSVKAEEEKLTVGLASASANAVKAGETLAQLRFAVTGRWDETAITLTAVNFAGKAVNESMTLSVPGSGYRFRDVKAEDWFFEAVDHLAAEGCIAGITENSFGPALDMTRASFLTLLGRLAGVELTHAETRFTDVPADSFYSGYVAWAVEKGITGGVDATHFAPAAPGWYASCTPMPSPRAWTWRSVIPLRLWRSSPMPTPCLHGLWLPWHGLCRTASSAAWTASSSPRASQTVPRLPWCCTSSS